MTGDQMCLVNSPCLLVTYSVVGLKRVVFALAQTTVFKQSPLLL